MTAISADVEVFEPLSQDFFTPLQGRIKGVGRMWILQTVFFVFSSTVLLLAYITRSSVHGGCLDQEYIHSKFEIRKDSMLHIGIEEKFKLIGRNGKAPVLAIVGDRYRTLQFNGTFGATSAYKGPPSPKVDTAWNSIVEGSRKFLSLNQSFETTVQQQH